MGVLISFSGIDGAGKSTQVRLLEKYLKSKKKSVFVTEKMFGYFLLKPLIKQLRKTTGSPSGGPVVRNDKLWPKMWFIIAFFDIWIGYWFDILPTKSRFDYIIADRFYTDIWANLLYYGYLPKWAFDLIKLLPKADRALVFRVNPENVRTREDDFPLSYYKQQAKIYSSLSGKIDCITVDANLTPKTVSKKIIQLV